MTVRDFYAAVQAVVPSGWSVHLDVGDRRSGLVDTGIYPDEGQRVSGDALATDIHRIDARAWGQWQFSFERGGTGWRLTGHRGRCMSIDGLDVLRELQAVLDEIALVAEMAR